MKSQVMRSSRLTSTQVQARKKKNSSNKLSQSPTLASSYSQKSLIAHSYKNQPFPKQFRRKLWGKRFNLDLDYFSDQEEQISAVVQQQQEGVQKKIKKLPHFKIIADQGEFISKRSRIKSQIQFRYRQKCKSVQSLKFLPKCSNKKNNRISLNVYSALNFPILKIEINLINEKIYHQIHILKKLQKHNHYKTCSYLKQIVIFLNKFNKIKHNKQNLQNYLDNVLCINIIKYSITAQIQKLIVDQLDSRRRKQQSKHQDIQEIIIQEKQQDQYDNAKVSKLRQSLDKFETQSEYLKQLKDQHCVRKSGKQQDSVSDSNSLNDDEDQFNQNEKQTKKQHHEVPLQRQKLYQQIRQESSSGKEDDYQEQAKLPNIKEELKYEKEQEKNSQMDHETQ